MRVLNGKEAREEMANAASRFYDDDMIIAMDGSWPWGLCADYISEEDAAEILRTAAESYAVQLCIEAEIKRLLAARGYTVTED